MTEVKVSKAIQVPATKVWAKLSTFAGIENYSPIARSVTTGQGAGATRTCYLPDDAAIHEVLNVLDGDNMHMQYAITEGPFPITSYVSDVHVRPTGESSCEVTWGAAYDVEDQNKAAMDDLFTGFYNVIIESLEKVIKSEN